LPPEIPTYLDAVAVVNVPVAGVVAPIVVLLIVLLVIAPFVYPMPLSIPEIT
jgi:hypothetical protein